MSGKRATKRRPSTTAAGRARRPSKALPAPKHDATGSGAGLGEGSEAKSGGQESVKVAVRLRPFNSFEKRHGIQNVISIRDNQTTILDPLFFEGEEDGHPREGFERHFQFDYSYTSFDREDPEYASQEHVFNDLGQYMLRNAWDGYNCSLFAYGQTGAGKSYTVLGSSGELDADNQSELGLLPRIANALFDGVVAATAKHAEASRPAGTVESPSPAPVLEYNVEVSYLEIYNEAIKDLFNPKSGSLRVREHQKTGSYVEDLTWLAVKSYAEMERLLVLGSQARTVASTNMNAQSSRSHAVFTIVFTQRRTVASADGRSKQVDNKVSKMSLVDLAGSERAGETGATGKRLKEAANINKSLSTLGSVIAALAKGGEANFVPYRNSVLTHLLKESLGGNARTVMIAAISPSADAYFQSLSTLKYVERAKKIVTKAVVNQDSNAMLVTELRSEIESLKAQLAATMQAAQVPDSMDVSQMAKHPNAWVRAASQKMVRMARKVKQREKLVKVLHLTWEEKRSVTKRVERQHLRHIIRAGASPALSRTSHSARKHPHLVNLNPDPALSETMVYPIKEGEYLITNVNVQQDSDSDGASDSGSGADAHVAAAEGAPSNHDAASTAPVSHPEPGTAELDPPDKGGVPDAKPTAEVGTRDNPHRIMLAGEEVMSPHARIVNHGGVVTLYPCPGAETFVNGVLVAAADEDSSIGSNEDAVGVGVADGDDPTHINTGGSQRSDDGGSVHSVGSIEVGSVSSGDDGTSSDASTAEPDTTGVPLGHGDRVIFGVLVFRFSNPGVTSPSSGARSVLKSPIARRALTSGNLTSPPRVRFDPTIPAAGAGHAAGSGASFGSPGSSPDAHALSSGHRDGSEWAFAYQEKVRRSPKMSQRNLAALLTSEVGTQQLQTGSEEGFEQQLWQAVDGTQQVRRPASAGDVLKSDGSGEAPRVGRKEWMARRLGSVLAEHKTQLSRRRSTLDTTKIDQLQSELRSAKIAKATEAAMLKVRLQRKQRMADGHALASEELRCMLRETQGMALADSEARAIQVGKAHRSMLRLRLAMARRVESVREEEVRQAREEMEALQAAYADKVPALQAHCQEADAATAAAEAVVADMRSRFQRLQLLVVGDGGPDSVMQASPALQQQLRAFRADLCALRSAMVDQTSGMNSAVAGALDSVRQAVARHDMNRRVGDRRTRASERRASEARFVEAQKAAHAKQHKLQAGYEAKLLRLRRDASKSSAKLKTASARVTELEEGQDKAVASAVRFATRAADEALRTCRIDLERALNGRDSVKEEAEALRRELKDTTKLLAAAQVAKEASEQAAQAATSRLEAIEQVHAEALAAAAEAHAAEVNSIHEAHNQSLAQAAASHAAELSSEREKTTAATREAMSHATKLQSLTAELQATRQQLKQAQADVTASRAALKAAVQDHNSRMLREEEARANELESALAAHAASVDRANRQREEAAQKSVKLESKLAVSRSDCEELRAEVTELRGQLQRARREVEAARVRNNDASTREAGLRAEVASLTKRLTPAQSNVRQLRERVGHLTSTVTALEARAAASKAATANAEASAAGNAARLERVEAAAESLRAKNKELEKIAAGASQEARAGRGQLERCKSALEAAEARARAAQREYDAERQAASARLVALEDEGGRQLERAMSMNAATVSRLEEEVAQQRREVSRWKKKATTELRRRKALQARADRERRAALAATSTMNTGMLPTEALTPAGGNGSQLSSHSALSLSGLDGTPDSANRLRHPAVAHSIDMSDGSLVLPRAADSGSGSGSDSSSVLVGHGDTAFTLTLAQRAELVSATLSAQGVQLSKRAMQNIIKGRRMSLTVPSPVPGSGLHDTSNRSVDNE